MKETLTIFVFFLLFGLLAMLVLNRSAAANQARGPRRMMHYRHVAITRSRTTAEGDRTAHRSCIMHRSPSIKDHGTIDIELD